MGALLVGVGATAASATDPVQLGSTRVTDLSDALSSAQENQVNERYLKLSTDTGVDFFAVLVPDFTNPSDTQSWAAQTATMSNMADTQYLVAIATEGRSYTIDMAQNAGKLSSSDREAIMDAMAPSLQKSDWSGALLAAADKADDILVQAPARAGRTTMVVIGVLVAIAVIVVIVVLIARARKRAAAEAEKQQSLAELARTAGVALVQADDALKSSKQELEFARAQFGDDSIAEYAAAIDAAAISLDEAFGLKQKLDDEIPDTEQEKRQWNERIIQLCTDASAKLEEKKASFDELRKLTENAPAALENVKRLRAGAVAEIDRATQVLGSLGSQYAPTALAAVADNPTQARSRIAFADGEITKADQAIAAGENGTAAVAIRAAEGAVQQATDLEDAVDHLADQLKQSESQLAPLVAELTQDITVAQSLPDPDGRVAQAIATTQQQLAAAQQQLSGAARSPLEAFQSLQAANTQIDTVVQQARDAAQRAQRAQSQLQSTMASAQAQYQSAYEFIMSRRGAVGATARTRLAESSASLERARANTANGNVEGALSEAERALQLAREANSLAQNDVGGWGGDGYGGGSGGGGGDSLGALLGGILIGNSLGGGRSRGGSWGGGGGGFSVGGFGGGGRGGGGGGRRF